MQPLSETACRVKNFWAVVPSSPILGSRAPDRRLKCWNDVVQFDSPNVDLALRSCHQAAVPRGSICRASHLMCQRIRVESPIQPIPNSHISTGHERSEGGIFHHHSLPPTGVELT
jgi:hypothetical protein